MLLEQATSTTLRLRRWMDGCGTVLSPTRRWNQPVVHEQSPQVRDPEAPAPEPRPSRVQRADAELACGGLRLQREETKLANGPGPLKVVYPRTALTLERDQKGLRRIAATRVLA